MLAEFDAAVAEEKAKAQAEEGLEAPVKEETEGKRSRESFYSSTEPKQLHCKRCKTLMEKGVCPTCGYKVYQGMDEAQRKKIRGILTAVCLGIFLVLFVIIKLK